MKTLQISLIFLSLISQIYSSNILAVWPVVSRTHFSLGVSLFSSLAEKGHTITLISPFEQKGAHENIKMIRLDGATESARERRATDFEFLKDLSAIERLKFESEHGRLMTEFALSHNKLKEVIESKERFDLFIYDAFYSDALLGITYYLDIPVVAFSCIGSNRMTDEMAKNPANPSYIPSFNFVELSDEMNFFERIKNTAFRIYEEFYYHFRILPDQEAVMKNHLSEIIKGKLPKLINLIHNVNLVLVNSHPLLTPSRPHTPNTIEIGGLQLRTDADEMHPQVDEMMNKAEKGIIYFSLGGQFRSADLPEEKLQIFIKTFSELLFLDIVVLWKFETIDLKDRHDYNVVIGPWLPQQEILNHKNLRAFITHGGLLSTMEAVYYGKPIIGIPILSSHKYNMAQAEREGYGIALDYEALNEDTLRRAIDAIFNDTSYRENAERMSEHLKDNQITQIDKAVWYVEHIIKTNGAHYLRTAATKLSFWEIYLIDQILLASMLIAMVIVALSKAVKWTRVKFQKRFKSTQHRSLAAAALRKKLKSN